MERSRNYYAAHGYDTPYEWAHFDDIPFSPLSKPLAQSTTTIVTTSMPTPKTARDQRGLHIGDLKHPPQKLFTDGLAWDRDATHTNDLGSYFPVEELRKRRRTGEIGQLAQKYYCVPTRYSQRLTTEQEAPAVVASSLNDRVDIALLVPL
ncbi:MAG TPA: hypothetical protein DGR97_13190 [Gammaproteobacteria bacterium]|nr:hypothetical protein [Gammaproteobacteria bacterium]